MTLTSYAKALRLPAHQDERFLAEFTLSEAKGSE